MINRLNHIGVVVADLDEAKRFLGEVLGLELVLERDVPARQRSTAYFAAGEVEIELIEDHDPEAKAAVLGGATAVIEHISFDVDDVALAARALAVHGVQLRGGEIVRVGTRNNAWTDPSTSGGVMYQLSAETTD